MYYNSWDAPSSLDPQSKDGGGRTIHDPRCPTCYEFLTTQDLDNIRFSITDQDVEGFDNVVKRFESDREELANLAAQQQPDEGSIFAPELEPLTPALPTVDTIPVTITPEQAISTTDSTYSEPTVPLPSEDTIPVTITPEQSINTPEQSINTPEHSINTPEQSINTPEQSINTPDSTYSEPMEPLPTVDTIPVTITNSGPDLSDSVPTEPLVIGEG
jgi:hypothetical protein